MQEQEAHRLKSVLRKTSAHSGAAAHIIGKYYSLPVPVLTILIVFRAFRPNSPSQDRSGDCDDTRREASGRIASAHPALEALGTLRCRAAVGYRPGRLQSTWDGLGIFSARPCTFARVSLGGRRDWGDQRPSPAGLFRAGVLEWARSDPKRALFRL